MPSRLFTRKILKQIQTTRRCTRPVFIGTLHLAEEQFIFLDEKRDRIPRVTAWIPARSFGPYHSPAKQRPCLSASLGIIFASTKGSVFPCANAGHLVEGVLRAILPSCEKELCSSFVQGEYLVRISVIVVRVEDSSEY